MKKTTLLTLLLMMFAFAANGQKQTFTYSGTVSGDDGKPVDMATVVLTQTNQWAVTDSEGRFAIGNITAGTYTVHVDYLGMVPLELKVEIKADLKDVKLTMQPDNLAIAEVIVTARQNATAMNTERKIERTAIDHLQVVNMSDISALMPGGKTVDPNLMNDNAFSLRDGGVDKSSSAFGTAVEVDGVRLTTNSSFADVGGASTRNVASSNIESIEVVTGIPSVEYGDMTGGMVIVNTKKGKTPYTATFTTNPNTKQFSLGKGFDLNGRGVVNANFERTKAIANPTSPYTSYQRNVLSLNYSNTIKNNNRPIKLSIGATGNIGGMNSENDPDNITGTWEKISDNSLRINGSANFMVNRSWLTSMELTASVNYADKMSRERQYFSSASELPAVNTTQHGYFVASQLPLSYYNVAYIDSKQLDYNASLKANINKKWGATSHRIKWGLNYKANGNVGQGEYYLTSTLPDGYRPRPYSDIPYMHNAAIYVEDNVSIPVGATTLSIVAGLRGEKTFIKGSDYKHTNSLSPRANAKWTLIEGSSSDWLSYLSVRGGWGVTEKLPSFNVLYPDPQYRDVQVFGTAYSNSRSIYVYHTTPYQTIYNPSLRWTRNHNTEVAVDAQIKGVRISVVGFYNKTVDPYRLNTTYQPFSYKVSQLPDNYTMPDNPQFVVDSNTGNIYVYDNDNPAAGATLMDEKVTNQTFAKVLKQDNGSPVVRRGIELTADFGQIRSIRTDIRLDASYTQTIQQNEKTTWNYSAGTSHTQLANRSYQYVGIYAGSGNVYNGQTSRTLNTNLTLTTHIPQIRMIMSLRVESTLLYRSRYTSNYHGRQLAFTVGEEDNTPTGGNINDGNSYTAVWPLYYMDLDGNIFEFTQKQADDPDFAMLIERSGNIYTFKQDGYDPYFTANLSVTKEIGNLASISFYANNFTRSRHYVTYYATGVKSNTMIPSYSYGLTVRIKF